MGIEKRDRDEFQAGIDAIAEQCIASRLRLLNRCVTGIYDDALRPLGLKGGQLTLLTAIAKMGEAKPAVLSEMFHMDASTVSRNLDRMRQRGWIAASPGEDGRTVLLSLTESGRDQLRRAIAAWRIAQERAADLLGEEGVSRIQELVHSLERAEKEA